MIYSNEIVFRGHPDKVCDQISDALLDAYMEFDPNSRCGIEVAGGKGKIFITGEVTSKTLVDVENVVRKTLSEIGYPLSYEVINNLGIQSKDIALGTSQTAGGAGDQGMMFGFACNDTPELLPTAMVILQRFSKEYDAIRKIAPGSFFPDGKAQITGEYEGKKLKKIKTFTISYHNPETIRDITDHYLKAVALSICKEYGIEVEGFLINPTGRFSVGGFEADAGLTGRKIVVDNYQSFANVGGGAFSGKDPTKVDRSGAYKARQIAKRYVKERGLEWCEVQISYAIGIKEPLSIYINSDQGLIEPEKELYEECEPQRIINDLGLKEIKYEELARFGHFLD